MSRAAVVITVSDGVSRGEREDRSGPEAVRALQEAGFEVDAHVVVPDDRDEISGALTVACGRAGLVITTGGTGLGPRDVTPEATRAVIERDAPGLAELLRMKGLEKTPHASLARGVAGVRGTTLIVNLPGSSAAVSEGLEVLVPVLPHALDLIGGHTEHD